MTRFTFISNGVIMQIIEHAKPFQKDGRFIKWIQDEINRSILNGDVVEIKKV